ncbi:hypothetical protein UFOVP613_39 [uncultured Caudovirales phage]|uniref:Uncharacterized protein n=1 Tax=uncultured Caudovirales phage TaxID=2100421 RepID=A0A6J5N6E4_9CAUD|nr:hypothetical protein UFOVP613_39 [uncultured Caudovirales phage]
MAPVTGNNALIVERLASIERELHAVRRELAEVRVEMAETRGAYRLARFVVALLGVSGLGGLLMWFQGQNK